jgi:hypothetical protein
MNSTPITYTQGDVDFAAKALSDAYSVLQQEQQRDFPVRPPWNWFVAAANKVLDAAALHQDVRLRHDPDRPNS